MSVGSTDTRRWLRIGFLGDGLFKMILAVVYTAATAPIGAASGAGPAPILLAAALLLLSGIAESVFALRSAAPSHTRYLVAYDSGWILVTVVVVVLMSSGGALWFWYQAIASAILAFAFAIAAADADRADHTSKASRGPTHP